MVVKSIRASSKVSGSIYTQIQDATDVLENNSNLSTPTGNTDRQVKYHNHWQEGLRRNHGTTKSQPHATIDSSPCSTGRITLRRINLLKSFKKHIFGVAAVDSNSGQQDNLPDDQQHESLICSLSMKNTQLACEDTGKNILNSFTNSQPLSPREHNASERERISTFISYQDCSESSNSEHVRENQVSTSKADIKTKWCMNMKHLNKSLSINLIQSNRDISANHMLKKTLITDFSEISVPDTKASCGHLHLHNYACMQFNENKPEDKKHMRKDSNVEPIVKEDNIHRPEVRVDVSAVEAHMIKQSRVNEMHGKTSKSSLYKEAFSSEVSVSSSKSLENVLPLESWKKKGSVKQILKDNSRLKCVVVFKNDREQLSSDSDMLSFDIGAIKLEPISEETSACTDELGHNENIQCNGHNKCERNPTKRNCKKTQNVSSCSNLDSIYMVPETRKTRAKAKMEQNCQIGKYGKKNSNNCHDAAKRKMNTGTHSQTSGSLAKVECRKSYSEKLKDSECSISEARTDLGKYVIQKKIHSPKLNEFNSDSAVSIKLENPACVAESKKSKTLRKRNDTTCKLKQNTDLNNKYSERNGTAEIAKWTQIERQVADLTLVQKHEQGVWRSALEEVSSSVHKNEVNVFRNHEKVNICSKKQSSGVSLCKSLKTRSLAVNKHVTRRSVMNVESKPNINNTSRSTSNKKLCLSIAELHLGTEKMVGTDCTFDDAKNSRILFSDVSKESESKISEPRTVSSQTLDAPVVRIKLENTDRKPQELTLDNSSNVTVDVLCPPDLQTTAFIHTSLPHITKCTNCEQKSEDKHLKMEIPINNKISKRKQTIYTCNDVPEHVIDKSSKITNPQEVEDAKIPRRNLRNRKTGSLLVKDFQDEESRTETSIITRRRIKAVKKEEIKMATGSITEEHNHSNTHSKKNIRSQREASLDDGSMQANKITKRQKTKDTDAAKSSRKNKRNESPKKNKIDIFEQETSCTHKQASQKFVGVHCSIAGGVSNAVKEAVAMGARAFGMFVRNGRTWKLNPLDIREAEKFKAACREHGFLPHLILPHGSYLLNCGSSDPQILQKSRDTLVHEMKICEMLGLELYNFHPGNDITHFIKHV